MLEGLTVSNSSALIALEKIGQLHLLEALYGEIHAPLAVLREWGIAPPDWIQGKAVQNQGLVTALKLQLGAGEAEAIALASECAAQLVILDDKKARRIARANFQLPVTGTLAILLVAKEQGLIQQVRPAVDSLEKAGFHISKALRTEILQRAVEEP